MREHTINDGMSRLVLEWDRIVERWRTGRWDSLVANGPAWHDQLRAWRFAISQRMPLRPS